MVGFNVVSLLFFPEWLYAENDPMKKLQIRKYEDKGKAQDFTLRNLDGQDVSLSNFAGKIVFLNFWATWCVPCRKEMPAIEKLYQEFREKGLVVLALNWREDVDKIKPFLEEVKLSFPILLDSDGKVYDAYAAVSLLPRAIPISYLINQEGMLIGGVLGDRDWASKDAKKLIKSLFK